MLQHHAARSTGLPFVSEKNVVAAHISSKDRVAVLQALKQVAAPSGMYCSMIPRNVDFPVALSEKARCDM
jgi:hypothetical protein